MNRKILLNPGPVTISERVRKALLWPDMCHREKEFTDTIQSIRKDLVELVNGGSEYTAILFSGSGTTVMEAAMMSIPYPPNCFGHGRSDILIIENGVYGARFASMANVIADVSYCSFTVPWGTKINVSKVERMIEDKSFSHVFVTHHETTTGILNPIEEVGKICRKHDVKLVADAISSVGAVPIDIKKCNVDYLLGTSNKCIQGIPGVGFVIARKKELMKTSNVVRSVFLNLYKEYKSQKEKGLMRFTAPTYSIFALRAALDELRDEGIENRYKRYCKSYDVLERGLCNNFGFKLFDTPVKSKILGTFCMPDGFDFNDFHDKLYSRGFTIYPGKVLDERTFRVAVMGDLHERDIKNFLKAVGEVMK